VTMAQMGFFDLSDRHASLDAKRNPLVDIDAIEPWEEFHPVFERVWPPVSQGSCPPLCFSSISQVGGIPDRKMIWDIHRNENQRC
jgi:hypothetical protein